MNQVFWHQNANRNKPDVFIIDGALREELNVKEQDNAFSLMRKARSWPSGKQVVSLLRNIYPEASSQLAIYYNGNNEVYLQSDLLDRDDVGRRIPFMLYTDKSEELTEQLMNCAQVAGVEVNREDLRLIEKALWLHKNKIVLLAGGAIAAGLIIYALCS